MKLEYDKDADAAYVYFKHPVKAGDAKRTIAFNDNIIIDFDKNGKLIGVEILSASKVLNKGFLTESLKHTAHAVPLSH